MGVALPPLPDEGDSGEAEDGTKTATGNEESLASPLAGGQSINVVYRYPVSLRLYY